MESELTKRMGVNEKRAKAIMNLDRQVALVLPTAGGSGLTF